jgi:hypothetical protein
MFEMSGGVPLPLDDANGASVVAAAGRGWLRITTRRITPSNAAPRTPATIHGVRDAPAAPLHGAAAPQWGQKRAPRRRVPWHLGQLGVPRGAPQSLQKLPVDLVPQEGQGRAGALIVANPPEE